MKPLVWSATPAILLEEMHAPMVNLRCSWCPRRDCESKGDSPALDSSELYIPQSCYAVIQVGLDKIVGT